MGIEEWVSIWFSARLLVCRLCMELDMFVCFMRSRMFSFNIFQECSSVILSTFAFVHMFGYRLF